MENYSLPTTYITSDGTGRFLVFNGKRYYFPDPNSWGQYSKLNEFLGQPNDITATSDIESLPLGGNISDLGMTSEQLRQVGEQVKQGTYQSPTTPQSPEEFADQLFDAEKETIDRETAWLEQYTVDNPFAFDEELAKLSAKTEYEPYYSELLQDYLENVSLKRTTIQDEQNLLTTLYKMDETSRSRSYDQAVGKAEEGFAGQGMFFSGIKKRTLGEKEVAYKGEKQRSLETYTGEQKQNELELTGLATEEEQKRRDIGREQETAITGGIETRRGEAMTQYYAPFVQAYKKQFPTGTMGVEGYLPESFLQYRY